MIMDYDNPNDMWHVWKNTFNTVAGKHAPLRFKRIRASQFKSPRITSVLKRRMHQRDVLRMKASSSNNPDDWGFKRICNLLNSEIKSAKELYYTNALHENKNDLKMTWSAINDLTSRKRHTVIFTSMK